MERVTKVRTFDGLLHDDQRAAQRHLDKIYGEALSKIAHKIISDSDFKYSKLLECLDGNLDAFKKLMQIKADMRMENPDEDE